VQRPYHNAASFVNLITTAQIEIALSQCAYLNDIHFVAENDANCANQIENPL